MTEIIKQWIADQGNSYLKRLSSKAELTINSIDAHYAVKDFSDGLTKGIEIAKGFDLWKIKIGAIQRITGYYTVPDSNKPYSFSQLLEKYIEQLGK